MAGPNSFTEWVIGFNLPRPPPRPPSRVEVEVTANENQDIERVSVTIPRVSGNSNSGRDASRRSKSKFPPKKVQFEPEGVRKSALKNSRSALSFESASEVSPSSETSAGRSSDQDSGKWQKPRKARCKANSKSKSSAGDATFSLDPHPDCSCDECKLGRKVLDKAAKWQKIKKAKEKPLECDSDTTLAVSSSEPEPEPDSEPDSDSSSEAEPSPAPSRKSKKDKKSKVKSPKSAKANKGQEKSDKDNANKSDKSKHSSKGGRVATFPRRENRNSDLLMPARAQVVEVEHKFEDPSTDPRPNAFLDNGTGICRMYHGEHWGNPHGSLYSRKPTSKPAERPAERPASSHTPHAGYNWGGPPGQHYQAAVPSSFVPPPQRAPESTTQVPQVPQPTQPTQPPGFVPFWERPGALDPPPERPPGHIPAWERSGALAHPSPVNPFSTTQPAVPGLPPKPPNPLDPLAGFDQAWQQNKERTKPNSKTAGSTKSASNNAPQNWGDNNEAAEAPSNSGAAGWGNASQASKAPSNKDATAGWGNASQTSKVPSKKEETTNWGNASQTSKVPSKKEETTNWGNASQTSKVPSKKEETTNWGNASQTSRASKAPSNNSKKTSSGSNKNGWTAGGTGTVWPMPEVSLGGANVSEVNTVVDTKNRKSSSTKMPGGWESNLVSSASRAPSRAPSRAASATHDVTGLGISTTAWQDPTAAQAPAEPTASGLVRWDPDEDPTPVTQWVPDAAAAPAAPAAWDEPSAAKKDDTRW
ncbi:hypothetical protein B0T24DRAFT_158407 [Lasiosphaeria ovina]|uniref:Uncharacterized protein n=1 Tax=Lasiosphaeria ovina TaxID=92902 RepID=A0AAE0KMH9_9PEZI|nr:hypothetical protein B0T24DRAFT_158407 [Lasiosphaeria ovina]